MSTEPLGVQLMRAEPALADDRFAVVLGFESPTDAVFQSGGRLASRPRAVVHTGSAALAVRDGTVTIRLSALLADRVLPGAWSLVGAYVYADGPAATVTASYVRDGATAATTTTRELPAKRWTPVLVDLSTLANGPVGELSLAFRGPVRWLDDVVLVDNARSLVPPDAPPKRWTIERKGSAVVTRWPTGSTTQRWVAATSPDDPAAPPDAYRVVESNAVRLLLTRGSSTVAVYSDGRAYADGRCVATPFDLPPQFWRAFMKGHDAPATIEVADELGQVDRLSAGDANNDGYNETTGVYTVTARGGRLDLTIRPTTNDGRARVVRPIIEIAGMPAGAVSATVEGKDVPIDIRTPAGHVLLEVPLVIERPVTINVSVR